MGRMKGVPGGDVAGFGIGEFELDIRRMLLLKGGQVLDIEPKPLEVLKELLIHPGELVTKAELMDSVWASRIVTEGVITRCISRLRIVLRDTEQTLILTAHGYGYRYTGPVRVLSDASPAPAAEPALDLSVGAPLPLRPLWRLDRKIDPQADVWLAQHSKTQERRVLKFAASVAAVSALKRELTILRLLRQALGERNDFVRLLDYNFEAAPYFLEFEFHELGSLRDWLASADAKQATLAVRLQWIAQAAESLAAAHAVGVLHQDIKPSNILLRRGDSGDITLCWSDFGVGAVSAERLDQLQLTPLGMTRSDAESSSGTLTYLAPERLAGEPATLRSDIYSLGLILYQMVVGDPHRTLAPGWERQISDELLRDDIAVCCDLDASRRIGDVAELAHRLRTLDARRAQLAAQRRASLETDRLIAVAARRARLLRGLGAITLVVLLCAGFSMVQWSRAKQAQAEAETAEATAQEINRFLNEDLLGASDSYTGGRGQDVGLRTLLASAETRLDKSLINQPEVYAQVSVAMAKAYGNLGRYAEAHRRLSHSVATLQDDDAATQKARFELQAALGDLLLSEGNPVAAEPEIRQALAGYERLLGSNSPEVFATRSNLAWDRYEQGYFSESYALHHQILDDMSSAGLKDPWIKADVQWQLIDISNELGLWDESTRHIADVEAFYLSRLGAEHSRLLYFWLSKAYFMMAQQHWMQAESLLKKVLLQAEANLGPLNPVTTTAKDFLGTIYLNQGDAAAALPLLQAALDARQAHHGKSHYMTRMSMNRVGRALSALGRHREALAILTEAFDLSVTSLGANHPHTLDLEWALAEAEAAAGQNADSERHFREVIALGPQRMPANNFRIAESQQGLGQLYLATGRKDEARAALTAAADNYASFYGVSDGRVALVQGLLKRIGGKAPPL